MLQSTAGLRAQLCDDLSWIMRLRSAVTPQLCLSGGGRFTTSALLHSMFLSYHAQGSTNLQNVAVAAIALCFPETLRAALPRLTHFSELQATSTKWKREAWEARGLQLPSQGTISKNRLALDVTIMRLQILELSSMRPIEVPDDFDAGELTMVTAIARIPRFQYLLTDASVQLKRDWQLTEAWVVEASTAFNTMTTVNTLSLATRRERREHMDLAAEVQAAVMHVQFPPAGVYFFF